MKECQVRCKFGYGFDEAELAHACLYGYVQSEIKAFENFSHMCGV